jgi:hypothetical protein
MDVEENPFVTGSNHRTMTAVNGGFDRCRVLPRPTAISLEPLSAPTSTGGLAASAWPPSWSSRDRVINIDDGVFTSLAPGTGGDDDHDRRRHQTGC